MNNRKTRKNGRCLWGRPIFGKIRIMLIFIACAMILTNLNLPTTTWAKPYFEGKTITILIGFSAGGGVDLSGRILAKYMGDHIPGNPTVIAKNMAGASSIKAHNFVFEKAKADGQTLFYGPWFPVSQITNAPGIRFRYEDFTLIGALREPGRLLYIRTDAVPGGFKKGSDVMKAKNLKFAGQNPYNTFDLHGRLTLDLFNLEYVYVTGYRGSAKIRPAILENEVNVATDSLRGYRSHVEPAMVKTGKVAPLWSCPIKNDDGNYVQNPDLAEVPTFIDVHREVFGKDPSGPTWEALDLVMTLTGVMSHTVLGPPNMNDEVKAILRKAFIETVSSKPYFDDSFKAFDSVSKSLPLTIGNKIIAGLPNVDPKLVEWLKDHIASGAK